MPASQTELPEEEGAADEKQANHDSYEADAFRRAATRGGAWLYEHGCAHEDHGEYVHRAEAENYRHPIRAASAAVNGEAKPMRECGERPVCRYRSAGARYPATRETSRLPRRELHAPGKRDNDA